MEVNVQCPSCQMLLTLDSTAGQQFQCPGCGRLMSLKPPPPKPAEGRTRPPSASGYPNTPARPLSRSDIDTNVLKPKNRRRKREGFDSSQIVFWGLATVLICGGLFALISITPVINHAVQSSMGVDNQSLLAKLSLPSWDSQVSVRLSDLMKSSIGKNMAGKTKNFGGLQGWSPESIERMIVTTAGENRLILLHFQSNVSDDALPANRQTAITYEGHSIYRVGSDFFAIFNRRFAVVSNKQSEIMLAVDRFRGPTLPELAVKSKFDLSVRVKPAIAVKGNAPLWLRSLATAGVDVDLQGDSSATVRLAAEAVDSAAARTAASEIEKVKSQLSQSASPPKFVVGAAAIFSQIAARLGASPVVLEGHSLSISCTVSKEEMSGVESGDFDLSRISRPGMLDVGHVGNTGPGGNANPSAGANPAGGLPAAGAKGEMTPPVFLGDAPPYPASGPPTLTGPMQLHLENTIERMKRDSQSEAVVAVIGVGFRDFETAKTSCANAAMQTSAAVDVGFDFRAESNWFAYICMPITDIKELGSKLAGMTVVYMDDAKKYIFVKPKL